MLFTFLFLIIILLFHHTRRGQGEGAQLAGEGVGWLLSSIRNMFINLMEYPQRITSKYLDFM